MIGITSTRRGKGLNKSPKTALNPTFQPTHLPNPRRASTKPPSPIGTPRSSHLSPETNIKIQNLFIYNNLKGFQCKPQNSPCTTEIHTENQYFTLLVKPRVQPRFLHRLLLLCFSCNPVIPKNKKSPETFPFFGQNPYICISSKSKAKQCSETRTATKSLPATELSTL